MPTIEIPESWQEIDDVFHCIICGLKIVEVCGIAMCDCGTREILEVKEDVGDN